MTTTTVTSYEIPLEPVAQTFQIALAGVTYSLTLWWSSATNCWNIDIADANQVSMIDSIPLVTGLDLLGPFAYLGFGGQLVVQTDHDINAVPTFANLGSTGHVYFVVTTVVPDSAVSSTNIYFGTTGGTTGGTGRETIPHPPGRGLGSA